MDSPIVAQLFRQLFHHRPRGCQGRAPQLRSALRSSQRSSRSYATRASADRGMKTNESRWQQRTHILPEDRREEFAQYPYMSIQDLKKRAERPRKVKMLLRDFIDDSLYNPSYGYFSKQAVIFSPGEPFDFPSMRDELEFQAQLGRRYTEFEDGLDDAEGENPSRQLWHTPTELFRPSYGEAVARYLVSNYRLTTYPYDDLLIYEMGAGRGTLMLNILDYIRQADPQVYARTKFNIIEISPSLADLQGKHLRSTAESRGHADRVDIINKSIFEWDRYVPSPCFFLAMEVFDNFAHDGIRYDVSTEEPLQGHVLIDGDGDFYEFYVHELDPVAARFFRVRHAATGGNYPKPYPSNPVLRYLSTKMPFAANLSDAEFIPTRLMQFFDVLEKYFPAHRLLTSDFDALPQAVRGLNAPVVQTRYQRRMVPVTTPLVHQGYFDILFPTDFRITEAIYRAITGKLTRVTSHGDFMRRWAYVEDTQTRSGENPLLSHYKNASVMITV
ncbi:NADH dehydrogenase [ubiquinone] complex I, assembly factor 7 [Tolypocladium ophioglossoides CBS 100239]|uniref:Protein arginine methyltransferase NDUFAF7 n=1 Tax=Tolypocladium ophioglossoides (strain CBS 100239) TaxID=1163406 RepID=A0A0L0NBA1_TOLOC|nr:NADH dehydrogenase [ubiquinone] complex I, assembly factor 7 [Tolypocladium ophioglossoides CBS 100239]